MTTRRSLILASAATLAAPLAARAQARFPDRPVRIVVPFPPGGNVDFTARLLDMLRSYRAAAAALPDAVVVLDRNSQRVQWFNEAATALLGLHHPGDLGEALVERLQPMPLAHWLARALAVAHWLAVPLAQRLAGC